MDKELRSFLLCILLLTSLVFASVILYAFYRDSRINVPNYETSDFQVTISGDMFIPAYNELFFSGGRGYEFKNENSSRLIIYLGGFSWRSSLYSVMGSGAVDLFLSVMELYTRYTFFVPEKFNRLRRMDYVNDPEERERYTINNLIDNYSKVISEYLLKNDFESIIIIGFSEGGLLLPVLYNYLDNKNIVALVSMGAGDFTDRYVTYSESASLMPQGRTEPITYRYSSSVGRLNVSGYFEKIHIPVLFVHGKRARIVPVTATEKIEQGFPDKPFDFIYYPYMDHQPAGRQTYILQRDVTEWIFRVDP